MIKYIKENKQWIFSGIGVFGISLLISVVLYMVWGRGSETKPPISASPDTQATASPNIVAKSSSPETKPSVSAPPDTQATASPNTVAKSSSPTHMSSTEPRPTKPTGDSQPDNKQDKDEEQFTQLLKEARKLLELGHPYQACRLYRQAVGILPDSKKREVSFSSIGEAKSSYDRDDFRTAANKYAYAFQKISIQ